MNRCKAARSIGVDLDATLAHYTRWKGNEHIGAPIEAMVKKVRAELAKGTDVRILTARVHPWKGAEKANRAKRAVEKWCQEHLGQKLEVTCEKHPMMEELWDDRARQVIKNTGEFK